MIREECAIKKAAATVCISGITISIIVPAYNEADNLADAIGVITSGIPASISDYEIIIIDDGSHDDTPEIIRTMAAANHKIIGLFHDVNQGKGAALRSGFAMSRMEWVLLMDADLQISISELSTFINETNNYDIITGYRQGRSDPISRRFFSRIYAGIIRLSLGIAYHDLNCPFKLIRKTFLDTCDLQATGFFIDTELMYTAHRNNVRIKELGVASQPRQKGISTVRFRHVIETVQELSALLCRDSKP